MPTFAPPFKTEPDKKKQETEKREQTEQNYNLKSKNKN